jgi:hypothetical protein
MTGPREELLSAGVLGLRGIALLYRTVEQVVRVRNLPPPDGMPKWTKDMLQESAHDVYAHRKAPERMLSLAARSTDEESFRQQLWTLVANDLASTNRRTARGKLHERLKDVTSGMASPSREEGRWQLAGAAERDQPARFDELVAAAAAVQVVEPAWSPLSANDAPVADRASLEAMITTVLATAATGLTLGDLTAVLASRLGVHDAPVHRDDEGWERIAPVAADDPAADVAAMDAAQRLVSQLTVKEQQVLPYLDESASVIAQASGLARTTAYKATVLAKFHLEELLADDAEAAATLGKAVELVKTRWGLS